MEQTDIFGGATPVQAPPPSGRHEQPALFTSPTTMRGQTAMSTNPACQDCARPIIGSVFIINTRKDGDSGARCSDCDAAAWKRIFAKAAAMPAQQGNDVTNVWD